MSILKVNTIQDKGGNAIISSDGSGTLTLGNDALKNTPNFSVKLSSGQSINNTTQTKVTWDSELYDSDDAFASNKFTVPSGKGGKYFYSYSVQVSGIDASERAEAALRVNGTEVGLTFSRAYSEANIAAQPTASGVIELSDGDYVELWVWQNAGSTETISEEYSWFQMYRLIGA